MASQHLRSDAVSLTVFLLLSAVLAVSVGLLASSLLRSLMKDQRQLEINSNEANVANSDARPSSISASQANTQAK
jgi:hypothetical protein